MGVSCFVIPEDDPTPRQMTFGVAPQVGDTLTLPGTMSPYTVVRVHHFPRDLDDEAAPPNVQVHVTMREKRA